MQIFLKDIKPFSTLTNESATIIKPQPVKHKKTPVKLLQRYECFKKIKLSIILIGRMKASITFFF
jgi:hypothetical protein